jgi:hypothetical protein
MQKNGFSLSVDDPEALEPAMAFCTTGELHVNLITKMVVVVFYCWRNEAAFQTGKKPFNSIQVNLPSNPETSQLLEPLLATGQFGSSLLSYCLTHCEELRSAVYRQEV